LSQRRVINKKRGKKDNENEFESKIGVDVYDIHFGTYDCIGVGF
jgi:hypothetical protein